ncbi:MAG: hypothetical protein M3077_10015 [Candidatus Dormibacteraeota bacterium]|nr:hypothetical protein [Candidatus Dormibacteraeota bacterium]
MGSNTLRAEAIAPITTTIASQTTYNRWGDYTSMSVDPTGDCTFWYTNEYQRTTGYYWSTWSRPSRCLAAAEVRLGGSSQGLPPGTTHQAERALGRTALAGGMAFSRLSLRRPSFHPSSWTVRWLGR